MKQNRESRDGMERSVYYTFCEGIMYIKVLLALCVWCCVIHRSPRTAICHLLEVCAQSSFNPPGPAACIEFQLGPVPQLNSILVSQQVGCANTLDVLGWERSPLWGKLRAVDNV